MKQPKYVGESMKASPQARAGKYTAGAASGAGRLQKTAKYGGKSKGK
jgi:hypothetical protein